MPRSVNRCSHARMLGDGPSYHRSARSKSPVSNERSLRRRRPVVILVPADEPMRTNALNGQGTGWRNVDPWWAVSDRGSGSVAAVPAATLTKDELHRIYGPWLERKPPDAAELFAGYPGRWWIAGGWAIEAFTGIRRHHSDLDPSIPRDDLPQLRRHLAGRIDLWSADQETLRVLLPDDIGDDQLADSCENVWARRSGGDPWEYDIILMSTAQDRWVFKRDSRISRPIQEIVWTQDGIDYLRPEIQLLHKARGLRAVDQQDFEAVWPMLDRDDQNWLQEALEMVHPDHPWLAAM